MDITSTIVGHVDFAQVLLYLFWLFFAGLVIYLQRENMREGYPLETEDGRPAPNQGPFPLPKKKTFKLPHGRGNVTVPKANDGDQRELALRLTSPSAGSPFEPTGDPMLDGVGPASWAERRDLPELDAEGHNKIVPMAGLDDFHVSTGRDPRGLPIVAQDGEVAGVVSDMWIDKPEQLVRYLEVSLNGGGSRLIPMQIVRIKRDRVSVLSIQSKHFANVPSLASATQVTLLEEEKICAYYAGGKLYATETRIGPLV